MEISLALAAKHIFFFKKLIFLRKVSVLSVFSFNFLNFTGKYPPISEICVQSKELLVASAYEYALAHQFFDLKNYGSRKSLSFYFLTVFRIFLTFIENYPAK